MKNIIVVTGGAGFVGSNLIEELVKIKKYKILSIDNYSSGKVSNHLNSSEIKYLKGNTKNISIILENIKTKFILFFILVNLQEYFKALKKFHECFNFNIAGSAEVFNFALENKIKLIYSATSASLGNNGKDMNLSPYAFTKAKNLELLENLKKWFNFKYEIVYFYNVYGPRQICKGDMATVVGIFEEHFKNKKSLPVVKPGSQTRRFTHIKDTVNACIVAWRNDRCSHYSVASNKSYSIIQLAKLFNYKIKYLPKRPGERFSSALKRMNLFNKVIRINTKIKLNDYIKDFLIKNS